MYRNERMVVLKLENTLFTYELDCIRGRTHNVKFTLENVEILSGGKKIFTNKHELNDIANAAVSLARPFWSYIFGGGGGGGSGSKASSSQQEAKSGDSKETKNFFEFTLRKKFREEPTEVHRFYKIYAKLTPITLTIEEQFVISVIKFIEEAIPSRILQGDDQAGASAPTQDPTADESSLQSHESDSGTTIIVGDLDLPELKINLSCKPANAKWKKAMLESSSSKRLMTLVDFITRFLGSFSNVPIEVAPLQRDGVLLFKNTDRLKEIILKHYGNQLIKRVIESSQGSGLLSTATYFAKVASKFGIFDNIL